MTSRRRCARWNKLVVESGFAHLGALTLAMAPDPRILLVVKGMRMRIGLSF